MPCSSMSVHVGPDNRDERIAEPLPSAAPGTHTNTMRVPTRCIEGDHRIETLTRKRDGCREIQSFSMVLPAVGPEARFWISVTSSTGMTAGFFVPFSSATLTCSS